MGHTFPGVFAHVFPCDRGERATRTIASTEVSPPCGGSRGVCNLVVHGLTPEAMKCRPLRGLSVRHGARITTDYTPSAADGRFTAEPLPRYGFSA